MLNNGTPNIAGFQIDDGRLVELDGSARPLSAEDADPAQVSFSLDSRTLVVTERGTDSISTYSHRGVRWRRRRRGRVLVLDH